MKSSNLTEEVGPEDIRPVLQECVQANLVYKGRLLVLVGKIERQLKKTRSEIAKKQLQELLVEVKGMLRHTDSHIKTGTNKVKRGHLRVIR